ncbi:integrase [Desulfosarcina ovata subsp. sediminis]|uniref:Integrase n=1 Tax=Desulfosarcina ovata subsp. sediminis TaxID=885957 RepID=A0A5K7ZY67_9BACT|nr:TOBE domain-containing protein [Desulfosarcina ovata]BBO85215.1 integrase [Desulfosarcina ovata subsp. sediminis]
MGKKEQDHKADPPPAQRLPLKEQNPHGRIFSAPDQNKCLDAVQLHQLEASFRDWAGSARRADVRLARRRILLIFLLIRYTGAKLSEVLNLDPEEDIDFEKQVICFGRRQADAGRLSRNVQLSETLCGEIQALTADLYSPDASRGTLRVDPGFVRRKFYERAEACGIAKQLGAPEILRKSRAVELMQSNMPLPAVQMLLGHSTPNLTSAYVSFSEEDVQRVTRFFMEKESARKTSARNTFFGKIQSIRRGDIQALVELLTIGGHRIATVITRESCQRLGLKVGALITAEVKAPWVMLQKRERQPQCSADNILAGIVERVNRGEINTELIVRLSDGTEVCSLVTTESGHRLGLTTGDPVWVFFNSFSVVLLAE